MRKQAVRQHPRWWNETIWRPVPQSSSPSSVASAVIAATLTPSPTATATFSLVPSDYAQAELQLEERINEFSASRGLSVLVHGPSLTEVARNHSEDMYLLNFFDHVNPDGLKPQDCVEAAGLLDFACGENLFKLIDATTDDIEYIVSEAFTDWLNSPSHYENMIAPSHDTGAIGIYVKPTFRFFDPVPQRYSIYVTHLLCEDMAEYNRLNAEYEVAAALYDQLLADYERLQQEYAVVDAQFVSGATTRPQLEAAYDEMETARLRLIA